MRSLSLFTLALALWACSSSDSERPAPTPPAPPTEQTPAPEKQPPRTVPDDPEAGPVVQDPRFELRATAEESYPSGELGRFGVTLTAAEGWHVNQDYPTNVTLSAPEGLSLPKSVFEKADAAEFADERARFDVPFTPGGAGEHRLTALVDFAVCTDETCIPVQRTLAVVLPVR